jgi:uncharacterized membrane protein
VASFTGSLWFVLIHLVWFTAWAVLNLGVFAGFRPFDPYPFQLLAMIVSLEGVLIATFVLIKQNRMGELSDRRAHVDLQVNLLAERETTRLLRLTEEIAVRLGVRNAGDAVGELSEDMQVEELAKALDRRLLDGDPVSSPGEKGPAQS